MRALFHRLYANPKYAKAFHWGKLITITGSAQILVQALSLISGILIIRLLSPDEYALYTLANTMLGTMVVLADAGISIGVRSQAAKVWQDKQRLGIVLATGLALRKKFTIASLLIALPVLFYLLKYHDASWLFASLIILALVPAFFASLSGTLLEIVPMLRQTIPPLQKIQVGSSVARLVLSCVTLVIFPWAFIAILAAGLPQLWANKRLLKISGNHALIGEQSDIAVRKAILRSIKRTLPGTIYYCLFGQITIWLISVFGNTSSIAQVGALGRVAMVFTFFSVLLNTLVTPRFARLPNSRSLLLNRFLQIQGGLVILGVVIASMAYIFSSQVLSILGQPYINLKNEFLLSVVGSYTSFIVGALFALNTGRGWVIHPLIAISLNLVTIVCSILLIDISTIKGLFIFNIIVMGTEAIIFFLYGVIKISKVNN